MKKNFWGRTNWATAQLYCEKKKLYCNTVFVLQRRKLGGLKLYCKRVKCIAIEAGSRYSIGRRWARAAGLCDTALGVSARGVGAWGPRGARPGRACAQGGHAGWVS